MKLASEVFLINCLTYCIKSSY